MTLRAADIPSAQLPVNPHQPLMPIIPCIDPGYMNIQMLPRILLGRHKEDISPRSPDRENLTSGWRDADVTRRIDLLS